MATSATATRPAAPSPLGDVAARVTAVEEREPIEVENPATGETLATVPTCEADDVEAAGERAQASQAGWARTGWEERRAILLRFHDAVLDRQDELLDLLQLESGKARRHGFEEIMDVSVVSRYYARTAERHLRPRRRRGVIPLLTAAWEHHHPVGVVGVIAPWNYPLTLSISDALPAV